MDHHEMSSAQSDLILVENAAAMMRWAPSLESIAWLLSTLECCDPVASDALCIDCDTETSAISLRALL